MMMPALLWLQLFTLLSLSFLLYQVIKQQGRILLRLEGLENSATRSGSGTAPRVEPGPSVGLPVGTAAPTFELPDMSGNVVTPGDFRGRWLFLVHWNPECGFCPLIAPELARWKKHFKEQNVQLVLASHGDAETNRALAEEHALDCPILLHPTDEPVELFRHEGTPVAYLLDEQGRVAHRLARGVEQVPALAEEIARGLAGREHQPSPKKRDLSSSRIERNGLKPGSPAPLFRLPDTHGGELSLDEYVGTKQILLVFSAPNCGPCNELAPFLVDLHQASSSANLAVLMVGQGSVEENREKAREYGFEFPVAVQKRWEVSKEYGIFATPVAFLIDPHGQVADHVAKGREQIERLAQRALKMQSEELVHD